MKLRLLRGLLLLAVVLTAFGCPTSVKPAVTETVDGDYRGTVKANGQTSSMQLITTQTSNQVAGTYTIGTPLNESGTVTGTIVGLIYNVTLKRTVPTAATFSTSVDISNGASRLVGTYGNGLYVFDLTRQ